MPLLPPIYLPGQEPLPAGTTDWERQEMQTALKYQRYMGMVMESCPLKVTIAGVGGESQWSLKDVFSCTSLFRPGPWWLFLSHVCYFRIRRSLVTSL